MPSSPGSPAALAALIGPLLDDCARPAGRHFDELVAGAAAAGALSPELAHQLRYWQRASVHEIADQVRSVLPAVLPAALSALTGAANAAEQAAAAARTAWDERDRLRAQSQPSAGTSTEPGNDPITGAVDESPTVVDYDHSATSPSEDVVVSGPEHRDDAADQLTPQHRRRLFVTGLTSTA